MVETEATTRVPGVDGSPREIPVDRRPAFATGAPKERGERLVHAGEGTVDQHEDAAVGHAGPDASSGERGLPRPGEREQRPRRPHQRTRFVGGADAALVEPICDVLDHGTHGRVNRDADQRARDGTPRRGARQVEDPILLPIAWKVLGTLDEACAVRPLELDRGVVGDRHGRRLWRGAGPGRAVLRDATDEDRVLVRTSERAREPDCPRGGHRRMATLRPGLGKPG